MNLYNINKEYLDLLGEIMDNEGELTPEIEQRLQINQRDLNTKATNYAYMIKHIDGNTDKVDEEIERLNALKKRLKRNSELLKERIKNAMNIYSIDKIETPLLTLNLRKSESIEIEDENLIPVAYKKVEYKVSKSAIKEAIKQGVDVHGASLKINQNLQIK